MILIIVIWSNKYNKRVKKQYNLKYLHLKDLIKVHKHAVEYVFSQKQVKIHLNKIYVTAQKQCHVI